jgi:hypothetical protein
MIMSKKKQPKKIKSQSSLDSSANLQTVPEDPIHKYEVSAELGEVDSNGWKWYVAKLAGEGSYGIVRTSNSRISILFVLSKYGRNYMADTEVYRDLESGKTDVRRGVSILLTPNVSMQISGIIYKHEHPGNNGNRQTDYGKTANI